MKITHTVETIRGQQFAFDHTWEVSFASVGFRVWRDDKTHFYPYTAIVCITTVTSQG